MNNRITTVSFSKDFLVSEYMNTPMLVNSYDGLKFFPDSLQSQSCPYDFSDVQEILHIREGSPFFPSSCCISSMFDNKIFHIFYILRASDLYGLFQELSELMFIHSLQCLTTAWLLLCWRPELQVQVVPRSLVIAFHTNVNSLVGTGDFISTFSCFLYSQGFRSVWILWYATSLELLKALHTPCIVRPLNNIKFSMSNQAWFSTEGLSTFLRFIKSVSSLMYFKVSTISKAFSTFGTFIRVLANMDSKVSKKLVMILKGFSTFPTLKGLLPGMDSFMDSEACTTNKALSALLALKWFHFKMNSLMLS